MLIHDTTNHLGGSLLSAFHYNDVIHLRHLDGVKAYQLHDGIGNPLVSDALGYSVSVSAMLVDTRQKNIAQAFILERYFFVSICPAAIPDTCLSVFLAAVLLLC